MTGLKFASRPSFTPETIAFVPWRTGTTLGTVLRVTALYSLEAGPVCASLTRSALVAVSYVSPGTGTASGTIGCVVALHSGEASRRVRSAGLPLLVTEVALCQKTHQVVDGLTLVGDFVVQGVHGSDEFVYGVDKRPCIIVKILVAI